MTKNRQADFPLKDGDIIKPAEFVPPSALNLLPTFTFPWLRMSLLSVSLIAIFAAWFVTSANSVTIKTVPVEATVEVKELLAPLIGGKWILRPGLHRVQAQADGYITYDQEILISDEALQSHILELEPLPGHLRVEISPVESAEVTIDEKINSTAPTILRDLAAGPHNIQVKADRYKTFEGLIDIQGKDIEQLISVELQPAWADVTFDSSPQGASVRVDGEKIGTTPLATELLEGPRKVLVQLAGYKNWQRTLPVVAGEALDIPQIVLSKADGIIAATSTPTGATITVDGAYQGKTPITLNVKPEKTLTIRAIKAGYSPASTKISVDSGDKKSISLTLKPELAQVRFIVTPADAEVLIDGVKQSSANQVLQLPTHEHKIVIRKAGFKSYQTTITPRKGIEKRIRVRLREGADVGTNASQQAAPARESSGAEQKAASDGSAISTFLNQRLKLFSGGSVKMGSSRRDPARRANEGVRNVTLQRPFYLGTKEVTNGEFRQFLANHVSKSDSGQDINQDNQPVANVTWNTAALFCNWLSRKDSLGVFYQIKSGRVLGINPAALGYRLPTEAEWALAARMAGQSAPLKYPWMGEFPPAAGSGNYADQSAAGVLAKTVADYNDGFVAASPVGSFAPNLNGLYDLGGNVAEWIHDFYVAAPAGNSVDPLGPRSGQQHVIRGSSWASGDRTALRLAFRDHGSDARDDLGFRIARYAK
ncbi:MAG: PEGA domain-containing protein [Gammaproteobacteria bacterium]